MFHEKVVPLPRAAPVASVQGTLALDLAARPDDAWPPPLATVHSLERRERRQLEAWAHRFAQAAVEIAGGDRPVSQLLRWTTADVYQDLARRAQLVREAVAREPHTGRVQLVRPHVESVHPCWLSDDAVEVSVRARHGHRSRAVAIRFERRQARWLAVAMEFA
jgi:hypothetical protein